MLNSRLADSEWVGFIARLEAAEEEFTRGQADAFT